MINRKQLTNIEKLTKVLNAISGRAETMAIFLKKEIASDRALITILQQDKIILSDKANILTTKVSDLEKRIAKLEKITKK